MHYIENCCFWSKTLAFSVFLAKNLSRRSSRLSGLARTSRAPSRLIRPRPIDCDREPEQTEKIFNRQNKYFLNGSSSRNLVLIYTPKKKPMAGFVWPGGCHTGTKYGDLPLRESNSVPRAPVQAMAVQVGPKSDPLPLHRPATQEQNLVIFPCGNRTRYPRLLPRLRQEPSSASGAKDGRAPLPLHVCHIESNNWYDMNVALSPRNHM